MSGSYAEISITSAQVTNFKAAVDDEIALSIDTLSVEAITANKEDGYAITSISQEDGKVIAAAG